MAMNNTLFDLKVKDITRCGFDDTSIWLLATDLSLYGNMQGHNHEIPKSIKSFYDVFTVGGKVKIPYIDMIANATKQDLMIDSYLPKASGNTKKLRETCKKYRDLAEIVQVQLGNIYNRFNQVSTVAPGPYGYYKVSLITPDTFFHFCKETYDMEINPFEKYIGFSAYIVVPIITIYNAKDGYRYNKVVTHLQNHKELDDLQESIKFNNVGSTKIIISSELLYIKDLVEAGADTRVIKDKCEKMVEAVEKYSEDPVRLDMRDKDKIVKMFPDFDFENSNRRFYLPVPHDIPSGIMLPRDLIASIREVM